MALLENAVFVWRDSIRRLDDVAHNRIEFAHPLFDRFNAEYNKREYERHCPYCSNAYRMNHNPQGSRTEIGGICPVCGFWWHEVEEWSFTERTFAALRVFDINDASLALNELGSHLNTHFSDIYSLTPRRFEHLVGQIFRNIGYTAELTPQTRDKGIDIVVTRKSDGSVAVVECKRFAVGRKVTIGIVQRLLGAMIQAGREEAFLVSTTCYTEPAKEVVSDLKEVDSGFNLTLIDLEDLARLLGFFNEALPPGNIAKELAARMDAWQSAQTRSR